MTELVQQEMPTKKEDLSVQLAVEQMQFHLDALKKALPSVKKIDDLSSSVFQEVSKKVADFALSLQTSKMDPEYLEAFFKHPYFLVAVPKKQETWNLYIPRFIDMQIGYLQQQTESWNIFLVNRYAEWLGGIPESLKKELGLKTPLELKLEGDILFGSGEAQKEAWKRYGPLLKSQDKEGIRVDPKRAFELIAALVKDGILPFSVRPIPSEDLVENTVDFELESISGSLESLQNVLQRGDLLASVRRKNLHYTVRHGTPQAAFPYRGSISSAQGAVGRKDCTTSSVSKE